MGHTMLVVTMTCGDHRSLAGPYFSLYDLFTMDIPNDLLRLFMSRDNHSWLLKYFGKFFELLIT
ncbi:hypothetical protein HAX54_040711, partial [Datura stramonium]|nr:hypothetical protein [Datura stramonium]